MRWATKPLAELADFRLGKMLDEKKNRGEPLPYLANVNVRWGEFDLDGLREMRFEHDEMDQYGLKHGDIVMCEGGEPGRCALWKGAVPGMMIQKALHRIRPHQFLDNRFLYYSFLHLGRRGAFTPLFTGATIKHLPREKLAKVEISFPPLANQRRIADILAAYDDLIENNRRRMALLEESARLLYREWFVRLRFPGYEHTGIVNGVPDRWQKGCVGNLVNVQSGYAFKSSDWLREGNPVIKIANIDKNLIDTDNCECVADNVAEKAKKFLLKSGDFLIAMTGATVGKVGIMPRTKSSCYLNQRVGILRSTTETNPVPFLFSFFNSEDAKQQIINFAAGAAQPNISGTQIEAIKLMLPPNNLLVAFNEFCEPLFEQRQALIEQNSLLKSARDLLLPRLMNGEIPV